MAKSRSRLIGIGIGIGIALSGGALALVRKIIGGRRRGRDERHRQAFTTASDGLWPPVPRAEATPVVIDAQHPEPTRPTTEG